MNGDLYFVAFYKHSEPQHLVAGPFVSWGDADDHMETFGRASKCIVKTTLPFEMVD